MLLKNTVAALVGLWGISVHAAPAQPVDLKALLSQAALKLSNGTIFSFPDSPTFGNATERWTTFDAPTYRAAVSPATEEDVAKMVGDHTVNPETRRTTSNAGDFRSNWPRPTTSLFSPRGGATDTRPPCRACNRASRLIWAS